MNNDYKTDKLGECEIVSPLNYSSYVEDEAGVLLDATVSGCHKCNGSPNEVLEQAGPRKRIFFEPSHVKAAMVTCGGLCPGLNDVVRALTMVLWYRYGVRDIIGLRYGYEGLVESFGHEPIRLSPEIVEDIHQNGGTILGSSRGPQDVRLIADFLEKRGINVLFAIGGDGTQRGALELSGEIARRGMKVSVIGIPKTIDNDVSFTERTFGFETAVAMSKVPITCAHMEAKGIQNGVGLVKLMGRDSGFIAAYATLASSNVNLLLVPEISFTMDQVYAFLEERFKTKSHAVIVVAEGAGQEFVPVDGVDGSGNRKLGDIGTYVKKSITEYFRAREIPMAVKYLDPSYMIRSAPASADDSVFCFLLSENAVHAAMTGRTAMVVGIWNGHFVHVPMVKAVSRRKVIDPEGSLWRSVLDNTGQDIG